MAFGGGPSPPPPTPLPPTLHQPDETLMGKATIDARKMAAGSTLKTGPEGLMKPADITNKKLLGE